MSNLAEQVCEALSMFARNGIEPAFYARGARDSHGPHTHHQHRGLIDFKLQGFLNDARRSLKIVTFGGAI
jgi:hypothetical protein